MRRLLFFFLLGCGFAWAAAEPRPLVQAHAHNDYEHARPLEDALERGFCSIEADIHLVDGQLLVAHDRRSVVAGRTLASLYLEPLRERVRRHGGRVYRDGPTIILLVDVKSEAAPTYAALHGELKRYREMLTIFRANEVTPSAVTVVVSGNRVPTDMLAQPERYAAMDGRKVDLENNPPPALVPVISENWNTLSTWRGQGEMPASERAALTRWVARAHAQGRQVRFWNTPDRVDVWRVLVDAGVDWLGTDDLDGLARFLRSTKR